MDCTHRASPRRYVGIQGRQRSRTCQDGTAESATGWPRKRRTEPRRRSRLPSTNESRLTSFPSTTLGIGADAPMNFARSRRASKTKTPSSRCFEPPTIMSGSRSGQRNAPGVVLRSQTEMQKKNPAGLASGAKLQCSRGERRKHMGVKFGEQGTCRMPRLSKAHVECNRGRSVRCFQPDRDSGRAKTGQP